MWIRESRALGRQRFRFGKAVWLREFVVTISGRAARGHRCRLKTRRLSACVQADSVDPSRGTNLLSSFQKRHKFIGIIESPHPLSLLVGEARR